jgi:mannose-6-phosphate isomerase-like protein (cupin superfamily)
MDADLMIVEEKHCGWETWTGVDVATSPVIWKTLVGHHAGGGAQLVLGVTEIQPDTPPILHRHTQPEAYYILEGTGSLFFMDRQQTVESHTAIYIPGDAPHCIVSAGQSVLRLLYVFPAGSFAEIAYVFDTDPTTP